MDTQGSKSNRLHSVMPLLFENPKITAASKPSKTEKHDESEPEVFIEKHQGQQNIIQQKNMTTFLIHTDTHAHT